MALSTQRAERIRILYRGSLRSCNMSCDYCPMEKSVATDAQIAADKRGLQRFTAWAAEHRGAHLGICFTPWGEVLHHASYQEAFLRLSHIGAVGRVVAQTNLTHPVEWLSQARVPTAALWCTYHPSQMRRDVFLSHCETLDGLGVRYSVGVVGVQEHFDEIASMRRSLPESVYLWVNAYKRIPGYYSKRDIAWLESIDPFFSLNNRRYPSMGCACDAGVQSFTVDEQGRVCRCHFVDDQLGNLYDTPLERLLTQRTCPVDTCGCYLGYVNLPELDLRSLYGDGLLERIPRDQVSRTGS